MSPRQVVEVALSKELNIIAVCDHNTVDNVAASQRAAFLTGGDLTVLPGMEICTSEDVHLLALFDSLDQALAMQNLVYSRMNGRSNRPDIFGEQPAVNEFDEVEFFNDRLLIEAVNLGLSEAVNAIHSLGGLAAASHVDRESYSLLGTLGFIPPDLGLDALEASPGCDLPELLARRPELKGWPLIRSSDAHFLNEIGAVWTDFWLRKPSASEILMALKGTDGRGLRPAPPRTVS